MGDHTMNLDLKVDVFTQLMDLDVRSLQVFSQRVKLARKEIRVGLGACGACDRKAAQQTENRQTAQDRRSTCAR
ncbi:MAG: hypothetical protein A2Y77_03310 [Planctomycetes bacterium RBG_13_62_9]|nr:MAG: hypothetical protein A2Y77_03310 [Planctomycetes bacterium RBG_13_62_9]